MRRGNMKPALTVIDMQKFFFNNQARKEALPDLVAAVNDLIDWAREEEIPIYQVVTIHQADRSTWNLMMKDNDYAALIAGTEEAELVAGIEYDEDQTLIKKTRQDTFIRTDFEEQLREEGIDTLLFAGVFTHGCVGRTAITAYQKDFRTVISTDATFSDRPKHEEVMFEVIRKEQEQKIVTNQELKELVADRRTRN